MLIGDNHVGQRYRTVQEASAKSVCRLLVKAEFAFPRFDASLFYASMGCDHAECGQCRAQLGDRMDYSANQHLTGSLAAWMAETLTGLLLQSGKAPGPSVQASVHLGMP